MIITNNDDFFFRLKILFEDECGVIAFKLLAEITPVEDFLYPIPDDYKKDAEALKGRDAERNKNSLLCGLSYNVELIAYADGLHLGSVRAMTLGLTGPLNINEY